jgi:hypothetical protein
MRFDRLVIVAAASLVTAGLAMATLQDDRRPPPVGQGQRDQGQIEQGVEVQVRGQVHEAFASPTVLIQSETKVVAKQPPEAINELPPEQRPEGENVHWIPGYWFFEEDRQDFLWVSGVWRSFPPEHEWVPGYWVEDAGGWRWVSGYWTSAEVRDVTILPKPPELIEENVPPARDANSTWVPGIWVHHDHEYRWRPGYWVTYQPGWVWIPAQYYWTPGGYIFVDGYWDHEFANRGLVFAPVVIDRAVITRPGWFYRPSFVVSTAFLFHAMFVHSHHHHYYFGDYYDAAFERRGFVPWVNYRVAGRVHDPLFTYYSWRHRDNRQQVDSVTSFYARARTDQQLRPGRTLADFRRGNVREFNNGVVTINNVSQVNNNIRMQNVQRTAYQDVSQRYKALRTERQRNEVKGGTGRIERDTRDRDATGRDADRRDRRDTTGRDADLRDRRDTTGRERDATGRERDTTGRERDATGRERPPTGRETTPPGRDRTLPPGKDRTMPPDRDATGRDRTIPPGRETTPPTKDRTVPPDRDATGRDRTVPPTRETTPPSRDRTVPPDRDTTPPRRETTPPGRERTDPPRKDGTGDAGAGNRYQRSQSDQGSRRPTGDKAPPPRPEQPKPEQRGRDTDRTPGKAPDKDRNPGKDR